MGVSLLVLCPSLSTSATPGLSLCVFYCSFICSCSFLLSVLPILLPPSPPLRLPSLSLSDLLLFSFLCVSLNHWGGFPGCCISVCLFAALTSLCLLYRPVFVLCWCAAIPPFLPVFSLSLPVVCLFSASLLHLSVPFVLLAPSLSAFSLLPLDHCSLLSCSVPLSCPFALCSALVALLSLCASAPSQ